MNGIKFDETGTMNVAFTTLLVPHWRAIR